MNIVHVSYTLQALYSNKAKGCLCHQSLDILLALHSNICCDEKYEKAKAHEDTSTSNSDVLYPIPWMHNFLTMRRSLSIPQDWQPMFTKFIVYQN